MYRIDNATAVASLPAPAAVGPKPDHFFTKGDPSTGIPATIVDDDWANAVQEELSHVIEEAGLTLDKTDRTQLKQALDVLFASGDEFTTQPQFNDTTKAATTAFVNRALGSYSGVSIETADRTMTAADDGKYIFINANGVDLTLPDPAPLRQGTCFTVVQAGTTSGGSLVAPGGVTMNGVMTGSASSPISLMNRALYEIVRVSSSAYQVTVYGGTNSLTANGYQVFPGGLIVQWGTATAASAVSGTNTTVTLPVAFNSACVTALATNTGAVASNSTYNTTAKTTTNFTVQRGNSGNAESGLSFNWIAFGY